MGFLTPNLLASLLEYGHGRCLVLDSTFGTNKYMVSCGLGRTLELHMSVVSSMLHFVMLDALTCTLDSRTTIVHTYTMQLDGWRQSLTVLAGCRRFPYSLS